MPEANTELIKVIDLVSRERNISKDIVFGAVQKAMTQVARKKYGNQEEIYAILGKSGEIKVMRKMEVVPDDSEDVGFAYITLSKARQIHGDKIEVGEFVEELLPNLDGFRIGARIARSELNDVIQEAIKEGQYNEYKDKVGEIVTGVVKRVVNGNCIVSLYDPSTAQYTESILLRKYQLKSDSFRDGDRVKACIDEVKRASSGYQVVLSRSSNEFLSALFGQEVQDIHDKVVEVKYVVRDCGSRAKIVVHSKDVATDPVAACVGARGMKVNNVIQELAGERIDVIPYSPDLSIFISNLIVPAKVSKVVIRDDNLAEIVVEDDQLSLAIGRGGQNVRLASEILDMNLKIVTQEQFASKRKEEFIGVSKLFVDQLDVDEVIGLLLAAEGFTKIDDLLSASTEDLCNIEGFDEALVEELRFRTTEVISEKKKLLQGKYEKLGITDEFVELGVTDLIVEKLYDAGVDSKDKLADLSVYDFLDCVEKSSLSKDQIGEIIMLARKH